jgi:uncharacterized phage protein gp47/JayE
MPTDYARPTPVEIFERCKGDLEGAIGGVTAQLRQTVEFAIAVAMTGVSHALHGHIAWVAEQILPDQAVERFLLRYANLFGVQRKAAASAKGPLTVTGTGGSLPADKLFVRVADGATYKVDALVAGVTSATAQLTAVTAGAAGNLAAGQKLSLVSPVVGVNSEAIVASPGLTGGTDVETLASLLDRLIDRIQRPPLGGAPGDHETWAKEVAGVTRAWEYKGTDGIGNPGLGKVAVTFVLDEESNVIPNPAKVAEVQAYLDARSPAEVVVFAPTPIALGTNIDLGDNDTPAIRAAVEAELQDMLRRDAVPGGTIYLSRINEAISVAAGEVSHNLIAPVANKTHGFGELAVYATPTFL